MTRILFLGMVYFYTQLGSLSAESLSSVDLQNQKIDEELGLSGRSWNFYLIFLSKKANLPVELISGLPPYSQQVEGIEDAIRAEQLDVDIPGPSAPSTVESSNPASSNTNGSQSPSTGTNSGSTGNSGSGNCFNPNNIPNFC